MVNYPDVRTDRSCPTKPSQDMSEPNIALQVEFIIIKNVIASAMEAEIGAQFMNYQTGE